MESQEITYRGVSAFVTIEEDVGTLPESHVVVTLHIDAQGRNGQEPAFSAHVPVPAEHVRQPE